MWHSFFDLIVCINLDKRIDRWADFCEQAEKIGFEFKRKAAIEHEKGAYGLLLTMVEIFKDALGRGLERILVFEDDTEFTESKEVVDDTMNKAIAQLPADWLILYLGAQLSIPIRHFHSPNLIPVVGAYSTHSWAISKKGMEVILASGWAEPIDNHVVAHIQGLGGCFHVYPILTTQKEGFSDIGGNVMNWDAFISTRFQQRIMELKQRGYQIPV